jgi:phage shock protein PspC (stress-responsive transcriptional regulator)
MTTAIPSLDQPGPVDPPASPPQLRRSGTDRFVSGVSGGLAEYSGIDPVLWRVGFVALTVLGGSGVLFYALMWVLMPAAPLPAGHELSPVDRFAARLHDAIVDLGRRLQGR